jgi:Bacterial PH domain
MLLGPPLLGCAAAGAGLAVWRWERTRVVVTTEKLFVVYGTLRRRAAAVHLAHVSTIEVEQSLLGRLLGYGTLVAGELEIPFVPQPRHVGTLVARLSA